MQVKNANTFPAKTSTPGTTDNIAKIVSLFFGVDIILAVLQYVYFLYLYYLPLPETADFSDSTGLNQSRVIVNQAASIGMHGIAVGVAILTSIVAMLVVLGRCRPFMMSRRFTVALELLFNSSLSCFCFGLFLTTVVLFNSHQATEGEEDTNAVILVPGYVFYPLYILYAGAEWYFGWQEFRTLRDIDLRDGNNRENFQTLRVRTEAPPKAERPKIVPAPGKKAVLLGRENRRIPFAEIASSR